MSASIKAKINEVLEKDDRCVADAPKQIPRAIKLLFGNDKLFQAEPLRKITESSASAISALIADFSPANDAGAE